MNGLPASRPQDFRENAKWLAYYAPFRALSVSAAYLTPFFLEKGLSLTTMFLLQSIFSICLVGLEVPSGKFADRYGRAFSMKLAAPIATVALLAYGFFGHFWQFAVCEVLLAVANSLISGVDTTLLYDSLKAEGYQGKELDVKYEACQRRVNAYGFYAVASGVLVGAALVYFISISSTLVVDGLLSGVGVYFACKLAEAPHYDDEPGQEETRLSARHEMRRLAHNVEARWLVVLGSVLSVATWLGFWISAPYLTSLGIPAVLFGTVLGVRNVMKGLLSEPPEWLLSRWPKRLAWLVQLVRRVRQAWQMPLESKMWLYSALAGLVFLAMATGQIWLLWLVLGHDVVHALHKQPVYALLNVHIRSGNRATLNSLVNLVQRLVFTAAGPLAGWLIVWAGLSTGFVVMGLTCSALAFVAMARLSRLRTFRYSDGTVPDAS